MAISQFAPRQRPDPAAEPIVVRGRPLDHRALHQATLTARSRPELQLPAHLGGGALGACRLRSGPGDDGLVAVLRLHVKDPSMASRLLSVEAVFETADDFSPEPVHLDGSAMVDLAVHVHRDLVARAPYPVEPGDINAAVQAVNDQIARGAAHYLRSPLPHVQPHSVVIAGFENDHPCCPEPHRVEHDAPPALLDADHQVPTDPARLCTGCDIEWMPDTWASIPAEPLQDLSDMSGSDSELVLLSMRHPSLERSLLELYDHHWLQRHAEAIDAALKAARSLAMRLSDGSDEVEPLRLGLCEGPYGDDANLAFMELLIKPHDGHVDAFTPFPSLFGSHDEPSVAFGYYDHRRAYHFSGYRLTGRDDLRVGVSEDLHDAQPFSKADSLDHLSVVPFELPDPPDSFLSL